MLLSLLLGGEEVDVGEDKGASSSVFFAFFLLHVLTSVLLLVTILLLLLFLRDFNAGDNCSVLVGGEGGEFGVQADAKRPGWKNAGFAGIPNPVAMSWLAIRSCEGVNMVELGNDGKATDVKGVFNVVVSSGSTFIVSRIDRISEKK